MAYLFVEIKNKKNKYNASRHYSVDDNNVIHLTEYVGLCYDTYTDESGRRASYDIKTSPNEYVKDSKIYRETVVGDVKGNVFTINGTEYRLRGHKLFDASGKACFIADSLFDGIQDVYEDIRLFFLIPAALMGLGLVIMILIINKNPNHLFATLLIGGAFGALSGLITGFILACIVSFIVAVIHYYKEKKGLMSLGNTTKSSQETKLQKELQISNSIIEDKERSNCSFVIETIGAVPARIESKLKDIGVVSIVEINSVDVKIKDYNFKHNDHILITGVASVVYIKDGMKRDSEIVSVRLLDSNKNSIKDSLIVIPFGKKYGGEFSSTINDTSDLNGTYTLEFDAFFK